MLSGPSRMTLMSRAVATLRLGPHALVALPRQLLSKPKLMIQLTS